MRRVIVPKESIVPGLPTEYAIWAGWAEIRELARNRFGRSQMRERTRSFAEMLTGQSLRAASSGAAAR